MHEKQSRDGKGVPPERAALRASLSIWQTKASATLLLKDLQRGAGAFACQFFFNALPCDLNNLDYVFNGVERDGKCAAVVVALPPGRGSEWRLEKFHIQVAHPQCVAFVLA